MISILEKYNEKEALGILARASLSLCSEDNPDSRVKIEGESEIRESIFNYFRDRLKINTDDFSNISVEKIGDAIDDELDNLISGVDYDSALKRLSDRGDLPSDLFELEFNTNTLIPLLGDGYEQEKSLIENTVKDFDMEYHCEPMKNNDNSSLMSLFAKYYRDDKRKNDSFVMLVIGQRNLSLLSVGFAIRIYDAVLMNSKNLMDMLRGFAKKFGCKINVNGKEDFFFLDKEQPNIKRNIEIKESKHVFFQFAQTFQDAVFYITFAIDSKKYRKSLRQHHFKFKSISYG